MKEKITYHKLSRKDIEKHQPIDRTEIINYVYFLQDGVLVLKEEFIQVPDWNAQEKQTRKKDLEGVFDEGATIFGTLSIDHLVGMSVLGHHPLKSEMKRLNLEGLWVSHGFRGKGIGKELF